MLKFVAATEVSFVVYADTEQAANNIAEAHTRTIAGILEDQGFPERIIAIESIGTVLPSEDMQQLL